MRKPPPIPKKPDSNPTDTPSAGAFLVQRSAVQGDSNRNGANRDMRIVQPDYIDQQRDCQDRTTAADEPEGEPDNRATTIIRTANRASSRCPFIILVR